LFCINYNYQSIKEPSTQADGFLIFKKEHTMELLELTQRERAMDTVQQAEPIISPGALKELHPLTAEGNALVTDTRQNIIDIMKGQDDRTLLVLGPCSEDESRQSDGTYSVYAFAQILMQIQLMPEIKDRFLIVMRCPPAKPRTELGRAGLEQDDLELARELLAGVVNMGMPLAIEVMDKEQMAHYGDLASLIWGGPRNMGSSSLRHTLSAYGIPCLAKSGLDGDVRFAEQAAMTIMSPHPNVRVTRDDGVTGVIPMSKGNPYAGLLWRGDSKNKSEERVVEGLARMSQSKLPYGFDAAHGNAECCDPRGERTAEGQVRAFRLFINALKSGSLEKPPFAVFIEAYLYQGKDVSGNTPGMSRTDECVGIETAEQLVHELAHLL